MTQASNIDSIISSGKFPPILLLFGEEEYLLEKDYRKLLNHFVSTEEDKYNFDIFDGNECSLDKIVDTVSQYPMMSERRIVVAKNFDKLFSGRKAKTDKANIFSKYLDNPLYTTFLILTAENEKLKGIKKAIISGQEAKAQKLAKDAGFPYDNIISNFSWNEYPKVWENELGQWISAEVKQKDKTIPSQAAELLAAQTGVNLRELGNEIDKLILYVGGKREITIEDVTQVSGMNRDYSVFELQKVIGSKNLKKSLHILEKMLSSDRQEQMIIATLTKYFINLWKLGELSVKNNDKLYLAKELGTIPFFVQDYTAALKYYNSSQIEKAITSICEADTLLKSTPTDSILIMERMLISIMA